MDQEDNLAGQEAHGTGREIIKKKLKKNIQTVKRFHINRNTDLMR